MPLVHHCSWRAVIPVRTITSFDVNCCCILGGVVSNKRVDKCLKLLGATAEVNCLLHHTLLTMRVHVRQTEWARAKNEYGIVGLAAGLYH